jgi:hypothetical protein
VGNGDAGIARPLAIDLYCGLGGWSEGLIAEGYDVIGFDIERHEYGEHRYPGMLVIQDVLTLHGSQFKSAVLIVASPPCQAYSYRAMPWSRAKALPPPDNTLFEACFRIQREACEAAGRHVPMVVENVRGAQPWVGRARWNFGSYYLWGDVPALMPQVWRAQKHNLDGTTHGQGSWFAIADSKNRGVKLKDQDGYDREHPNAFGWKIPRTSSGSRSMLTTGPLIEGRKGVGGKSSIRNRSADPRPSHGNSRSRKAASAMIAKIPLQLSRHIGVTYLPRKAV